MNFQLNRAFGLTLLAGALTFGASQVKAEVYKGTFDLPVEAYWGGAVLSPGEYTILVDKGLGTPVVRVRDSARQVVSVLVGPSVAEKESQRGRLTLVQINGAYVVKKFDAGLIGKSFSFATPKAVRNRQLESKATSQITVVAAATH
jgi:hypothetical protein